LEPKPGVPPSSGHLAEVLGRLRVQPAKLIMRAAYQDRQSAEWLHRQTGLPLVELPFTVGGTEGAKDLYGLFDDSIARLLAAVR
jgi:zinc/manganese transport system substrate-binding protein